MADLAADIESFNAASEERQRRNRERERQAGGGPADCPPGVQAGGGGQAPPSGPTNAQAADDDDRPEYRPNPAHNPRSSSYNPKKAPEPSDAMEVYRSSSQSSDGKFYGRATNGDVYRFSPDNAGGAHFSGGTGSSGGPRPIQLRDIPRDIRQMLGLGRR
jgi:hypothetical protein